MAASKQTLRGGVTQYLYTRDGSDPRYIDYTITAEQNNLDGEDAILDGVATGLGAQALSDMVAGHNWIDNDNSIQLDYNPITDQYGVIKNNYSIYKPE